MATGTQVECLLAGIRDANGNPLNAGKVYTYIAGTTTPATLYTDYTCSTPAANPVILDSNGRAQCYGNTYYKFVVKTSADVTVYTWDQLYFGDDYGASSSLIALDASNHTKVMAATSKEIGFYQNTTKKWYMDSTNFHLLPTTTDIYNIGSASYRVQNIYAGSLYLKNNQNVYWRNGGNSADLRGITMSVNNDLILDCGAGRGIYFEVNGSFKWAMSDTTYEFYPWADNALNIGRSSNRVASLYVYTLQAGNSNMGFVTSAVSTYFSFSPNGTEAFRIAAGKVHFANHTAPGTAGTLSGYMVVQINGVDAKIPYHAMS